MAALLEVKGAGVAGEWPCVVRYDPRGSGARHGRSRESGDDFGRRKGKVLPAGPAGQRDREGCGRRGCSGPSAWERVGRSACSAGRRKPGRGCGPRGRWSGLLVRAGERKGGPGCWAGRAGLGWFLFSFSGFSFPISPFLFLIQTNTQLGEFKFKFEFATSTQTNKLMHQHECNTNN